MIRTLRLKLISAAMASLFIVLLVIMAAISLLNYQNVVKSADSVLALLEENGGAFPDLSHEGGGGAPEKGGPGAGPLFSPELPYESRYFSVVLDGDGDVVSVNTGKIAAVDTSAAIEYAQAVWNKGRESGFAGVYRYTSYAAEDGTHLIFLDCSRNLGTLRSFILIGVSVSGVGLVLVFLLLLLLSGHIVKPFSRNYEKQKRFITDAGHELKTPLTIIDADAEILEMDLGENEWLTDIRAQIKRLTDLTNGLVLLARMDEEQPKLQMIDFPVSEVVEEAVQPFFALAKTRGKHLTAAIAPMLSMRGDQGAICRLVTILLDNAVKYSDPEGRISLGLERQKNNLVLTVFNTAPQVERESLAHLFDRFYRADQSRNSGTGGYGLGLSIASAIVSAHRGRIGATTKDGVSLQITVTLPLG